MESNPFSGIVNIIREDSKTQMPISHRLGTVISTMPLTVDVAGITQDEETFLKNETITHFEVGDNLFLIPIDDEQRYIIICKVVDV